MSSDTANLREEGRKFNVFAQLTALAALAIALVSLFLALQNPVDSNPATETGERRQESSLDRIRRERIIRAGYSGFKPYTIINPSRSAGGSYITGFSADLLEEMANRQQPPWQIEWHQVTFETLKADMESERFDVFADAVYQTVPRAADFGFTIPYSYFGVAVGLVRKGETRFRAFTDLDHADITIALAQGWTSTEFAQNHLTKPKFKLIAVADDPFIQLQEVVSGRADIALQDVPTIQQFYLAHKDETETLWLDAPPTRVPAGFMTRQGDFELLHFLDVSIRVLEADGTLAALDKKWLSLGEFPTLHLQPGTGLSTQE